ncbi:MAG: TetR/AcrR family transcriptional regulator [Clostridia bacterium]|nr:TetR/AcrR family transcriptional regulator [Clostridia bacterium]
MLKSIIERNKRLSPLSETEIRIIKGAVKLFLENGYSNTTFKMIQEETGVKLGNITYYFRAKEDMLLILIQEIMDFHLNVIEETHEKTNDSMLACAMEVALQIALCENNEKAWDLYHSAYIHPHTLEMIKDWTAKKNYHMLGDRLPSLSEEDFRKLENVCTSIELSALTTRCDRYYTLEDKITLTLDSIMKIYEIEEEERKIIIEKVLSNDLVALGNKVFDDFVSRLK